LFPSILAAWVWLLALHARSCSRDLTALLFGELFRVGTDGSAGKSAVW